MGKLITFLVILLVIDLLFIMTGQICNNGACSLGSIIIQTALNLQNGVGMALFNEIIGSLTDLFTSSTGLFSLFAGAATIIAGIAFRQSDTVLFIPIGATFAIMASDFVFIYVYLASLNFYLATIVMAPIIIIYIISVVEWVRGKD